MTRFTSNETDFRDGSTYRVEIDLTEPRRPMQRHIWTEASGEIVEQAWIPTIQTTAADLLKSGFRPA